MADQVNYELEKMLPELQDLEERGVFSKEEIKQIVKKRTDFEYQIHRKIAKIQDFQRYLEYEKALELLRKKRKQRLGLNVPPKEGKKGITLSDYSIIRRIHNLYQKACKKFHDVGLWAQYFEWSKSVNSTKALSKSFAKAIQLFPAKEIFWIMAADWEFAQNGNIASARILLQRALRINPSSAILWVEYFRLELLWISKLRDRRKVLFEEKKEEELVIHDSNMEIPDNGDLLDIEKENIIVESKAQGTREMLEKDLNPMQKALLEVAIPRAVYRNAIKVIPNDLNFRLRFLNIYKDYDDVENGIDDIFESIKSDFPDSELAQKIICTRPLLAVECDTLDYPMALKNSVDLFRKVLESRNLWQCFADFLLSQLNETKEPFLIEYLKIELMKCYSDSEKLNMCTLNMFLDWTSKAPENEKFEVIEKAKNRFPSSALVWINYLEVKPSLEAFKEAVVKVSSVERGVVYDKFADWAIQNLSNGEIEAIFEESYNYTFERWLRWAFSIDRDYFRKTCRKLVTMTAAIEFFKTALELERQLKNRDENQIEYYFRKIHEFAPHDLGKGFLL